LFGGNNRYDQQGKTALIIAVENKKLQLTEALLLNQTDPNLPRTTDGQTPLGIAVVNGHIEMVELLMKYGANPNISDKKGNTPFHLAACLPDENINAKIVNALGNPNTQALRTLPDHENEVKIGRLASR